MSTLSQTKKLNFRPGIHRESTQYAEQGSWYDGNRVRFRDKKPENIRGWDVKTSGSILGTGSRTLSFASAYVFVSGTAPTMSTAANAIDLLVYNARTTTAISTLVIKALATAP